MNEIDCFAIRDYQIKWLKEEKKNVVFFTIQVFTQTKKWKFVRFEDSN